MPNWLKAISSANPLTYEVDGLRDLMLQGGQTSYGLAVDCAVLLLGTAALVGVAARLYPRMTA
jgi:ABC-2 type transport system permease protein